MAVRRGIEASTINFRVCIRFFAEAMNLDENYQKAELYVYGTGGGSRFFGLLRKSEINNGGHFCIFNTDTESRVVQE